MNNHPVGASPGKNVGRVRYEEEQEARIALRTMPLGGHKVRAGDRVLVTLHEVGLGPQEFVEPHTYCPERPDISEAITFGVSIHRCPGERIAKLICVRAWQTLLRRYQLSAVDEPPAGSLVVNLRPRTAQ